MKTQAFFANFGARWIFARQKGLRGFLFPPPCAMMMPTDDGRERGGGMKKAAAWALCVLWMMVIFMMSEMSGDVSGAQSGFVTELVERALAFVLGAQTAARKAVCPERGKCRKNCAGILRIRG